MLANNPAIFNLNMPLEFPFGVAFSKTQHQFYSPLAGVWLFIQLHHLFQCLISKIAHDGTDGDESEDELLTEKIEQSKIKLLSN